MLDAVVVEEDVTVAFALALAFAEELKKLLENLLKLTLKAEGAMLTFIFMFKRDEDETDDPMFMFIFMAEARGSSEDDKALVGVVTVTFLPAL